MSAPKRRAILAPLVFVLALACVNAQDPRFGRLAAEHQFPQNTVNGISFPFKYLFNLRFHPSGRGDFSSSLAHGEGGRRRTRAAAGKFVPRGDAS